MVARWSEPHRRYHDLDHLQAVLDRVDELAAHADDVNAVRLAAFFHDAVYDPLGSDNEERSAQLAETTCSACGVDAERAATVGRLVRLTASHLPARGDRDGGVLCDADLAVLGGSPAAYASYASAVREEYSAVSDEAFRAGRAEILDRLLARPRLYATPTGVERWEARARRNVATELALLRRVG